MSLAVILKKLQAEVESGVMPDLLKEDFGVLDVLEPIEFIEEERVSKRSVGIAPRYRRTNHKLSAAVGKNKFSMDEIFQ